MSEPRKYRSKEAFRKAEAYRHIHHVPHGEHPPSVVWLHGEPHKVRVSHGDPPASNTRLDLIAFLIGGASLALGLYALGWLQPIATWLGGLVP